MARRITKKTEDSLVQAKQREAESLGRAEVASREADKISRNIETLKNEELQAKQRVITLEENLGRLEERFHSMRRQVDDAVADLQRTKKEQKAVYEELDEGQQKLLEIRDKIRLTEQGYGKKKHSSSQKIDRLYREQQSQQTFIEKKKAELAEHVALLENRIVVLRKEEEDLKNRLLPKKNELEEKIDTLQKELLSTTEAAGLQEKALEQIDARVYESKRTLEQTVAKRVAEEERIATLLEQLSQKESAINAKIKELRAVEKHVNKLTARLERERQEAQVQKHLTQSKVIE